MKFAFMVGLTAVALLPSNSLALSPAIPLAAGSIDSILPVIGAAYRCGINSFHTTTREDGVVLLFNTEASSKPGAIDCINAWIRDNAKRLNLDHPPTG